MNKLFQFFVFFIPLTKHIDGIYLGDKVKVFGQVGFVTGFTGKMVYVQDIDGQYIQNPSISYKQVKMGTSFGNTLN
ncbi:hypothetical protein AB1283_22765 [Bacillus sp. S13(2024)]|uniref:hypothetical protein n=1 Tax=unclassified Bacillus (in: firmicutes) TaxID=185979 RepID=UPI003D1EF5C1